MKAAPDLAAIGRLLRPRSVAIVGASATPGALGTSVLTTLERMRFAGDVHLINPKRDRIGTRPCLKSVDDLPFGVDVAVLCIPRAAVLGTVKALAARELGAAIIFSAGFAEDGAAGLADQRELTRIAAQAGLLIEGPNCLGFSNYVDGIALTFVEIPDVPLGSRPGIGIVSQSGALAAVVTVTLSSKQLGLSYSISTGNEAASGVEDYAAFLLEDPHTRAIALMVEQFRQPKRFLALARNARALGKAMVLLHPGRSGAARESAATHTGAMVRDYAVMRTQVEREGVLVADTLEEFCDMLEVIVRCRVRPRGGAAVLTESGAFKALTLDLCEDLGLPLPVLTDESAPLMRAALPEFVRVSNPADLTAQGLVDPDLYRRALAALLADQRFGCILLGIIQSDPKTCAVKFPRIINAIRTLASATPVIFAGLDEGAQVPEEYIAQLRELHVPCFPSSARAFRAVARICTAAEPAAVDHAATSSSRGKFLGNGIIAEYRAKELLQLLGIPFPKARLVSTVDAAIRGAAAVGYPVALKAQSAHLPHKSDAGGVILNVMDARSMADAWARLHHNVAQARPGLKLDGVLVETMSPPGIELIVGGRRDPEWGPITLAGFGGVRAEILKDVRLLPADLMPEEIIRELHKLKSGEVLRGFRGSPALDMLAVAHIIAKIGALLRTEPDIREIDLNPVMVYPQGAGAMALDALIVMQDQSSVPASDFESNARIKSG